MSNKTSILAIGIAAILMICALSGAVAIATNNSSNNGIADVSKVSDVKVTTSNVTDNTYSIREYQYRTAFSQETVKPMLPDNITDFSDVISDVADDTVLSEFLDGRAFTLNDTVYTIDSDTAALSYLYSLGYMSIGNYFVIDTFGINVTEEEEAEETVDATGEIVRSANSNSEYMNAPRTASLKALGAQVTLTSTICKECNVSMPVMFLDFADLTVADFVDANILVNPATTVAEKTEIMADSKDVCLSNVKIESENTHFLRDVENDFADKVMFDDIAKKNTMFTECMTEALRNYMFMMIDTADEAMETAVLDALTGSVFAIDGVPMVVEDAKTLASYLFCVYDFQIVGTSIITIDFMREYSMEDDSKLNATKKYLANRNVMDNNIDYEMIDMFSWSTYHFFDLAEVSVYAFTDIIGGEHYQMTTEKARLMGNGFASCVLSAYIQEGTISNQDYYDFWGIRSADEDDSDVDDLKVNEICEDKEKVYFTEVNEKVGVDVRKGSFELMEKCDVTTVLDVFMYTPFFYDGEFMTVEDIDTLGLYLSEQFLVITNDNMMSIATLNFEGVYTGIDSFPLENMPAMFFANFLDSDYFNNHCFGTANVYDGGYFYSMPSDIDELFTYAGECLEEPASAC